MAIIANLPSVTLQVHLDTNIRPDTTYDEVRAMIENYTEQQTQAVSSNAQPLPSTNDFQPMLELFDFQYKPRPQGDTQPECQGRQVEGKGSKRKMHRQAERSR